MRIGISVKVKAVTGVGTLTRVGSTPCVGVGVMVGVREGVGVAVGCVSALVGVGDPGVAVGSGPG